MMGLDEIRDRVRYGMTDRIKAGMIGGIKDGMKDQMTDRINDVMKIKKQYEIKGGTNCRME